MDFRRSGQLDERRRRVLMDEIAAPSAEAEKSQPSGAKGPVRAYSESVLTERQRRVSEFIPLRPFKVIATILLLLTAVAAIEALYIFTAPPGGHLPVTKNHTGVDHPLAALDLAARGNLGSWFSSLLFAGGSLAIMGLLSIRAHRLDDYRGRYRIWWWAAAAFAWASVDVATGLHDTLGHLGQLLAGEAVPGGHKILWIGIYGLVLGTLAVRASFEIWSSLPAVIFGSIASLLYFAGIALQLEIIPPAPGNVLNTVIASSLTLVAHVSLVTAVLLYARHVHLDAQGRLLVSPEASAKSKKKPKSKAKLAVVADDDEEEEKQTVARDKKPEPKKEEPKKETPAPAAKPAATPPLKFGAASSPQASASISTKTNTTPANQHDDDDEDEDDDEDRVSKNERRRLKKLARREGQQRRAA